MSTTQIRGLQLRLATLGRDRIDPAFEASLASIESNVASIFSTISTDAERIAAVEALTLAFQTADGTLQGAITALVNATKAGAGLEADGTLVLPVGQNYLTGATSLKAALGLLDAALKVESDARVAGDAALTTAVNDLVAAGGATAAADLAAAVAAQAVTDAAQDAAIANEVANRISADTAQNTAIANEVAARTLLNTTLSDSIAAEANARTTAVSGEASTRAAADTALQNSLDAEALARTTADGIHTASIATETSERIAAALVEHDTRVAAEAALDTRVTTLEGQVAGNLTYDKFVSRETPVGVVDGVNALYTLANTPYVGSESVFLNGMLQEPGVGNDYTIVGKDITLAAAPQTGDRVRVTYFR